MVQKERSFTILITPKRFVYNHGLHNCFSKMVPRNDFTNKQNFITVSKKTHKILRQKLWLLKGIHTYKFHHLVHYLRHWFLLCSIVMGMNNELQHIKQHSNYGLSTYKRVFNMWTKNRISFTTGVYMDSFLWHRILSFLSKHKTFDFVLNVSHTILRLCSVAVF